MNGKWQLGLLTTTHHSQQLRSYRVVPVAAECRRRDAWGLGTFVWSFRGRGLPLRRRLLAEAPKDGHLHVIDLASGRQLYSKAVTRVLNVEAPMTTAGTRFCPGSQGGAEWNGPAYSPVNNLIFTGEVDWCTTVHLMSVEDLAKSPAGTPK